MFFKNFTQHNTFTSNKQIIFKNITNFNTKTWQIPKTEIIKKKHYAKFLLRYVFFYFAYFFSTNTNYLFIKHSKLNSLLTKTFIINYKRFRFFPTLTNNNYKHTYVSSSLGLFKRFFLKPKSFKKSKQLYILSIHFFKKLFIFTQLSNLNILVKYIPKYLSEALNILLQPVTSDFYPVYARVNDAKTFLGKEHPNPFFKNIIFLKNKNYGFIKTKKKGKVKRKVSRKVIKNNNITD